MPPKRGSSGGPSKPKAGGKAGPVVKAKAKPAEALPDPVKELEKEAAEIFERKQPDGKMDDVIKLAQFADIIRELNSRKCMIWGDDPANIIRSQWKEVGGAVKKEIKFDEFKAWWVKFKQEVDVEAEQKFAEEEAKKAADAKAKGDRYSGDGVWKVNLKDLKEALLEAKKKGKTPLIIDNTENFRAETYFAYSSHIIECKKMIMDVATVKDKDKKQEKIEEVLEEERARFFKGSVSVFKRGDTAFFRMANTACDLKGMFNNKAFPVMALLDERHVAELRAPDANGIASDEARKKIKESPIFQMATTEDDRSDLEFGGIHPNFQSVVCTQFAEESYEEFLKEMIPLNLMQPIKPFTE